MQEFKQQRKLALLAFIFAFLAMIGFLAFTLFFTDERKIPSTHKSEDLVALRGSIYSKDNFSLVASKQVYRAQIDVRSIRPQKYELFLKLFQIYSGVSNEQMKTIRKKLRTHPRGYNVVLLKNIDAKHAHLLSLLAKKLYVQKFFKPFSDANGHVETRGLDILEHEQDRTYFAKDTLTPVIGYTRSILKDNIFINVGVKGLEKYYENCLNPVQDARIYGARDIGGNIILNKYSYRRKKIDGCNLHLNISLKLEKNVEREIDFANEDLKAKEILAAIMDSSTGHILALASTRRFNPQNRSSDLSVLNASAVEYPYEVGSIIKPLVFATAMRLGKLSLDEKINNFGGQYRLGKFIIRDDTLAKINNAKDVLIHSSNIGMIQIAKRLNNVELLTGLKLFNLDRKTGVDLPYEQSGSLPSPTLLSPTGKSVLSYGYGVRATFMQMLAAFNVFNNKGVYITPRIANYYVQDGSKTLLDKYTKHIRVLTPSLAATMKWLLGEVVRRGTGRQKLINGIALGGKTGTARIVVNGKYSSTNYNASFFGYADDGVHAYTIGVLVRVPTKANTYYASKTALPIFKQIVQILIDEKYLTPSSKPLVLSEPAQPTRKLGNVRF